MEQGDGEDFFQPHSYFLKINPQSEDAEIEASFVALFKVLGKCEGHVD